MSTYGLRGLLAAAFLIMLSMVVCSKSNAQVVATWTGGGDGTRYSDPANWNIGVVPINGATNYNVVVPTGRNIIFDAPGSISGISYGSGGSITVASGVAFNVNSVASLNSNIIAEGAGTSFTANGVGVVLGNNVRSVAKNGGVITTSATEYTRTSGNNLTAFEASGFGSKINATSLGTISVQSGAAGGAGQLWYTTYLAEGGGVLDLSNVQSIIGGVANGFNDSFSYNRFQILSGGMIDLSSLESITRFNRFEIDIESYSLPSLSSIGGTQFLIGEGSTFATNALQTISGNGGYVRLAQNSAWNASQLKALNDSALDFQAGSVANLQSLSTFQNSSITLKNNFAFNTGNITNFNNSRIAVENGAVLDLHATQFTRNLAGSNVALSATGAGSRISALNVTDINNFAGASGGAGALWFTTFAAHNGGLLDLSNVRQITGGVTNGFGDSFSYNRFQISTGGAIDLSSLEAITRFNRFEIGSSAYALPSLQTIQSSEFLLSIGTTLHTPLLKEISGARSYISMPVFSTWNAQSLASIDDTQVDLAAGATLEAPNLTIFRNSNVTVSSGAGFNSGTLLDTTNSRIALTGGAQLTLGITEYTNSRNANDIAFRADGFRSRITAPNMTEITKLSGGVTTFLAENSGHLDFSSVDLITGGTGSVNQFTARTGGRIDLGYGNVDRRNNFTIDGANSVIGFKGLDIDTALTTVTATNLGTLELSGSLSHVHTTEANFNLDNGRLHFRDTPLAQLEIAGENKGISNNGLGNFGFQQLRVGTASSPTTLILADNVNNGNRVNGMREVQYLLDVSGNGLVFSNGSGIVLNGHDMFVSNGQDSFFSVRDLIAPGQISVAYGGGFISLTGEIGHIINGDFEAWKPGVDPNMRDLIGIKREGVGTIRGIRFPRFGNDDNTVMEMIAGSPVEAFQFVSTPADDFRIQLEALALQEDGTLSLLLDDMVLQSWDWSELGSSDFTKMTFLANNQSFQGLTDVRLSLLWDGNSGSSVYIDNWRITAVPEPSSVVALVAMGVGGVFLRRRKLRRDADVVRSLV